jgi:hypothetical protein
MKSMLRLASLLLVPLAAPLAAPLEIDNRAPKVDEYGYRPADGATAVMNPPSFIWIHDPRAASYGIEWARKSDFSDAQSAAGFVWNTYTHSAPLAPAKYSWRYRFVTAKGETSGWSVARSVVVPAGAVEFPMPTRAQQRERVPAGHPRLFMRPEDLPRLRERVRGAESNRFAILRKAADRAIAAGPTPEPEHMGSATDKENDELVKYWWPNRMQADRACEEAETIAFVWLMTGENKYGEAARKWVKHLTVWDPDGPTNFRVNCEAGKVMLYRPSRAYDWAWDTLTAEDRAAFRAVMQRRVADAWKSGEVREGTGHLTRPYSSHGNRVWHKLAETGIALLGDAPEAQTWVDYAVNKFYACYPVWSDDDGGWHEGVSYWSGYMGKAVCWLQVAQSALGIDGLKKPFFAQVGDYPLYVAPPHSPSMGFGDLSYKAPSQGTATFLEYFVRTKGAQPDGAHAANWRWWMEQYRMNEQGGFLGFLYHANLPPLPAAKPPAGLPPSKIFRGIGVASLHSTLLDSRDDVHFLMKSSPFGTQSHGHNAHNSFQLNAYGESLLPACTYRDLHGSKFHYQWVHSTRAQNGVLVNGEGQRPHSADPAGRIAEAALGPVFDYISGDDPEAYGGRLTRSLRRVAFVKPDVIVIFDELAAKEASTFQFMLHGYGAFTVDEAAATLALERPLAGLTAKYLSPVPLAFRQWDGFEPRPQKEFPNVWHVEAGTREKRTELDMITVLVPHRAGQRVDWTAARTDTDSAAGVRIVRGGRTTLVAFRKTGAVGAVIWDGRPFEGPVLVDGAGPDVRLRATEMKR